MMKKHLLYLITSLALLCGLVALNSCSRNEVEDLPLPNHGNPNEGETVTLQIAGIDTRTALEEGGRVVWSEEDIVLINNQLYTVLPDPEDPTQATIPNVTASDSYLAYYAADYALLNDELIVCRWATTQNYVENGFAPYVCPMVAYSTGEPLYFRQVGALLKFGLTGESQTEVTHLTLQTDYISEYFWSDPAVLASGEMSYIALSQSYNSEYHLAFDTPVALDPETPRWFYFCLPPATYASGFQFSIQTSDGNLTTKQTGSGNSYTLESGKIYTLPALSYGLSEGAAPLQATIDNATAPFVLYTLTGEPNSTVLATIMRQKEFERTTPETLIDQLKQGISMQFDAEGRRSLQSQEPIPASTDCVLVYAYMDGAEVSGTPETLPFRTNDAQSPAPALTLTTLPSTSSISTLEVNLRTETRATDISYIVLSQEGYDEYMQDFDSELDFFFTSQLFAINLAPETLAQIATPEGADVIMANMLTPSSDYVILILAYGADGATDLTVKPYTTEAYVDPEATWVPVSTSATMECGIFSALSLGQFTIEGLTVEKLEDRDLFRVVDPFDLNRVPELASTEYGITEASDAPYYMMIDATNPDDVIVDIGVNQLNLLLWGNTPMSIATYNHMVGVAESSAATYDAASGTILFPTGSLVIMINGLYLCQETILRLNP